MLISAKVTQLSPQLGSFLRHTKMKLLILYQIKVSFVQNLGKSVQLCTTVPLPFYPLSPPPQRHHAQLHTHTCPPMHKTC